MSTPVRAIETSYAGCRFRSRLEARWAVFFDALGITWQYEPQGFDLPVNGRYLPDFWLPASKVWIEVKGAYPAQHEEAKIVELGCLVSKEGHRARLLAGDIPRDLARLPVGEKSYTIPDGCMGIRGTDKAFARFARQTGYQHPATYSFVNEEFKVLLYQVPPGLTMPAPGAGYSGLEVLGPGHELPLNPMKTVPAVPCHIIAAQLLMLKPEEQTEEFFTTFQSGDAAFVRTPEEESAFGLEYWGVTPGCWTPGHDEKALKAALAAARSARFEHGQEGAYRG